MKTQIVPRLVLVCVCAAGLLNDYTAPAQQQPPAVNPPAGFPQPVAVDPATGLPSTAVPIPEEWQKKCPKNITSQGLPLGEVVKLLREYFPEMNFLVDKDVDAEPINIDQLRNVTLEDVLTAIDLSTKGSVKASPVNERIVHLFAGVPNNRPRPVCRAFSLANYLAIRSLDETASPLADLEDAIKTCWKLLAAADSSPQALREPVMSLHKATKLLIVAGTPEQLDTVAQVIAQLDTFAGSVPPGLFDQVSGLSRKGEEPPHPPRKPGSSSTNKPASGK